MRVFRLVTPIVATMLLFAGPLHAEGRGEINSKIKAAMEAYDSFDYDGAKKQLVAAVAAAKKSNLAKDPVAAKVYLDLGVVAYAVPDLEGAKAAFIEAVKIDPKIQIEVAYKSPELAKLLETARADVKKGGGGAVVESGLPDGGGGAECANVKGLEHTLVESAKAGAPQPIEAMVGPELKVAKVSVMFRVEGSTEFTEVKLTRAGDCKFTGAIPAAAMKGSLVHYYVAAFNDTAKPVASKGSSGSPNIIEISGTASTRPTGGDDEDPISGRKKVVATASGGGGGESGGEVTVDAPATAKRAQKVFIGVTGGSGLGYVTGTTEGMNTVKNCCIGKSLLVITPELGYFVSRQLSIGIAARIGLPVDANLAGHATAAPAGLLRLRYSLAASGEGLRVMGQLGAGFLRNTIKLDASMTTGGDTDIVAQGPLLLGGGIGYSKRLGNTVTFIADLDLIAAIAVVHNVGVSPMNSGVAADASLGFAVGF